MKIYKTIEECQIEVKKRAVQVDNTWHCMTCFYNLICNFIKLINLFILLAIIWLVIANIIPLVQSLFIYVCVLFMECVVSKYNRSTILEEYVNVKFNIAKQCFEEYEGYSDLPESDKIKIFEEEICKIIGISKNAE